MRLRPADQVGAGPARAPVMLALVSAIHVATGVVIILVLAWSGAAKLREPQSMAEAMRALRVPEALAGRLVQIAVPWLEVALAAALLVTGGLWQTLAWCATLVLFVGYLVVIARAVGVEEEVSCNCFGAHSAPVGRGTVVRNILLVVAAVIGLGAALLSPTSLPTKLVSLGWQGWLGLSTIAVLLGLAWIVSREVTASADGRVPEVHDQPVAGAASEQGSTEPEDYVRGSIPVAVLERQPGELVLLQELAREHGVLLLYVSPSCGGCAQVVEAVDDYARRLPMLDVVVVVSSRDAVGSLPESVRPRAVVDVAFSVQKSLVLSWVPAAVLLGTDGLLAGGPVFGVDVVNQLVDDVVQEFEQVGFGQAEDEPAPA